MLYRITLTGFNPHCKATPGQTDLTTRYVMQDRYIAPRLGVRVCLKKNTRGLQVLMDLYF